MRHPKQVFSESSSGLCKGASLRELQLTLWSLEGSMEALQRKPSRLTGQRDGQTESESVILGNGLEPG